MSQEDRSRKVRARKKMTQLSDYAVQQRKREPVRISKLEIRKRMWNVAIKHICEPGHSGKWKVWSIVPTIIVTSSTSAIIIPTTETRPATSSFIAKWSSAKILSRSSFCWFVPACLGQNLAKIYSTIESAKIFCFWAYGTISNLRMSLRHDVSVVTSAKEHP